MFNSAVKGQPSERFVPQVPPELCISVLWGTPSLYSPQGPPAWEVKPRQVNSPGSTDLPVGFGAFSFPFFDFFAQSCSQLPRHEASFIHLHILEPGERYIPLYPCFRRGTRLPSREQQVPVNTNKQDPAFRVYQDSYKSGKFLPSFFSIVKCQILSKCSQ